MSLNGNASAQLKKCLCCWYEFRFNALPIVLFVIQVTLDENNVIDVAEGLLNVTSRMSRISDKDVVVIADIIQNIVEMDSELEQVL